MKKICSVISLMAIIFCVVGVTSAYAAESSKIAVINFNRVIEESNYGKKANTELTEWIKTRQNTLDEMKKVAEKLKKELDEQGSNLTPEARKSKEEELSRQVNEYQQAMNNARTEMQKRVSDVRNQMLQDIRTIIQKVGQDENYAFIIDINAVPFYDKASDVTDKVIAKYNDMKQ